jgi:putative transcriptional regulator
MVNKIKAIREEQKLSQQKLTKKIGVSRQTVYYLEKNAYNPSLEIIRKIIKVLNKKFEEIFYEESIIKDMIESLSLKELKEIAQNVGISYEKLASLSEISDEELTKNFNKEILEKISSELKVKFEDLFEM